MNRYRITASDSAHPIGYRNTVADAVAYADDYAMRSTATLPLRIAITDRENSDKLIASGHVIEN